MKKDLSKWLLTIVLLLPCLLTMTYATEPAVIASGYCGGEGDGASLSWSLTGDGTLRISGTGAMADFRGDSTAEYPWSSYRENICRIDIEEGVTTIGDFAFLFLSNVTSVSIADTVTSIGVNAFDSDKLRSITIPSSVNYIANNAFVCEGLSVIVFEGDAPTFDGIALLGRSLIAYYPASNHTWSEAINHSYGGTIVWLESGSEWVDASGYYGADDDRKNVWWKLDRDGVLTLSGNGSMYSSQYLGHGPWYAYRAFINRVVIEAGIESIGSCAFRDCYNIVSIEIPVSMRKIDFFAFSSCAIEEINLPITLTNLGPSAFTGCSSLREIVIPDNLAITELEGTFAQCSSLERVTIPDGVTTLVDTFRDCTSLKTIDIPASVSDIYGGTFSNCTGLSTIRFAGSAPTFPDAEWGMDLFWNVTATAYYPEGDDTWTAEVMQDYGGTLTWKSYDPSPKTIADTGRSISLGDQIYINQYITASGFDDIDVASKGGLLIWYNPVSEGDAVYGTADIAQAGLIAYEDEYTQRTPGIAAKNYADEVYLRVYIEVADGEYVYGPLVKYSVQEYCEHKINTEGYTTNLKKTCAALLHYGTMAQHYFNYNTGDPANANILQHYPAPTWMQ